MLRFFQIIAIWLVHMDPFFESLSVLEIWWRYYDSLLTEVTSVNQRTQGNKRLKVESLSEKAESSYQSYDVSGVLSTWHCCSRGLSETSDRQLRNTCTDLYVPLLKTACGQKCFSYRGAKLWNDLERESEMANTFTQFKSSLKNDKSWALSHLSFTFTYFK